MKYRKYGRGDEKVSEIGFGAEHLEGMPEKQVIAIVESILENGINIMDLFMSNPDVRTHIGNALGSNRKNMRIQGHIGSTWQNGQYKRTRNLDEVKYAFDDLLARLKTDYIDFGLLHYIDTEEDYDKAFTQGNVEFAEELKKQGVIKQIGFSSHNPVISQKLIHTGKFDMFMFSINPGFDMDHTSRDDVNTLFDFSGFKDETVTADPVRQKLYCESAEKGIGITVMKALGAGRFLKADSSPFGVPMSVAQCVKYALDRPAVVSVLLGCRSIEEIDEAMTYYSLSDQERSYSSVISKSRVELFGKCMYCNHCLPCPVTIDVAAVNKWLDLASEHENVPATVKEHYLALSSYASDCTACGQCEPNCPFGVPVRQRMQQALELFGI